MEADEAIIVPSIIFYNYSYYPDICFDPVFFW